MACKKYESKAALKASADKIQLQTMDAERKAQIESLVLSANLAFDQCVAEKNRMSSLVNAKSESLKIPRNSVDVCCLDGAADR